LQTDVRPVDLNFQYTATPYDTHSHIRSLPNAPRYSPQLHVSTQVATATHPVLATSCSHIHVQWDFDRRLLRLGQSIRGGVLILTLVQCSAAVTCLVRADTRQCQSTLLLIRGASLLLPASRSMSTAGETGGWIGRSVCRSFQLHFLVHILVWDSNFNGTNCYSGAYERIATAPSERASLQF